MRDNYQKIKIKFKTRKNISKSKLKWPKIHKEKQQ